MELERIALEDEYFIKRKLYPNVDFYSGLIYQAMGYPTEYFTVLFALGRMPGLAGPVGGDAAGQGPEDRPAAADLHRRGRAAVRADREALMTMTDQLDTLLSEQRRFPPPPEFAARANAAPATLSGRRAGPGRVLGRPGTRPRLDPSLGPGARVEAAARQVVRRREAQRLGQLPRPPPDRAPAQQGRDHLGGRARRPPRAHLLGARAGGRAAAPTRSSGSASSGATGSRSTCRWCPRPRSRCSPAPGSAPSTRWSSAASRPSPCGTGSTTRRRSRSSPPTAATGAARCCRSSASPTRRWRECPSIQPRASWSSGARLRRRRVVRQHGGRPRPLVAPPARARVVPTASPSRWTRRTCSSSSTPRAPPGSPRASSTPPAAISLRLPPPRGTSST